MPNLPTRFKTLAIAIKKIRKSRYSFLTLTTFVWVLYSYPPISRIVKKFLLLITCPLAFEIRYFNHSHPNPAGRDKNKLNFYFHTSLCYLKRSYDTTKKSENKILTQFSFQYNFQKCAGRKGLTFSKTPRPFPNLCHK